MGRKVPWRLSCELHEEGTAYLFLDWPLRPLWSGEDLQEALAKTGWILYDVEDSAAGGEACSVLACPECASALGDGFGNVPAPELVEPETVE